MKIEEATQTKDGTPWQFFMDCGAYVYGTLHYRESIILGNWIRDVTNSWPLSGVKMPEGPADWREAIAKRPEGV